MLRLLVILMMMALTIEINALVKSVKKLHRDIFSQRQVCEVIYGE